MRKELRLDLELWGVYSTPGGLGDNHVGGRQEADLWMPCVYVDN